MGALLDELRRLQTVELQLATLRRNREAKLRLIELHKRQVRQVEERLQEHRTKVRDAQKKIDELSLDVAAKEEAIDRHRQLLNRAKTNKEYAAILTNLNTEKADNAKVESQALQLMEDLQRIKNEGTVVETDLSKLAVQVTAAEQALKAFDEQSESECERVTGERDQIAARINLQTLDIFNRVAQHHDGEALAAVAKLRPKRDEWSCGGCNITVTLEVINALQSRDELQICKVCGRILYLDLPAVAKSARG